MKKDDVISHLQIMHTWASFAHERGKLLGLPEICSIETWTADAIELLKEQKIAMKPKNIDKVGGNCPVCGSRMARSHKYCYQCGQEMKWE